MTVSLANVAIQQFRDQFQILYQANRAIRGTTLEVHGVVGDAYKWPQLGDVAMQLRGSPQSLIPASDVDHPRPETSFKDFVLNTPTDKFQQSAVNADERSALARLHVKSIGRREDQSLIDALEASSGTTIAAGGVNLTVEKLREASAILNRNNVDQNNRTILIHANNLEGLLGETEVTSSDFNTVRALVRGEIDTFMGFKFITLGNRADEGGLPITGSTRTCFVYHMMSAGMVWRLDPQINVVWKEELLSWLTISHLSLGSSALQDDGIVKIDCLES